MREGLHPDRAAVAEGPDVREAVVDLGAARLPAASLAHRYQHVSGEYLDLDYLDGEIVEGVVALVQPLQYGLGAAVGLDGGPDDDVWRAQRLDSPTVARVDRRIDAGREPASLRHPAEAIGAAGTDTAAFASKGAVRRLRRGALEIRPPRESR